MTSKAIIQCSSSSSHPIRPYDVFVSFRGQDTRNNFTAFLFDALRRKGIHAFRDDQHIRKGESISPELLQAIAGSRIFVVVFSKDYASSTWCLRELEHICNCIQTRHRLVLPIFYDVDPSDVRKQSGCYEEAFAKYEERFREDKEKMEEVQRWRETLARVANLSGWDIRNKPQHAEIEKIVQEITNVLGPKFLCLPNDNLVGMESRVKKLEKLLHLELVNDVRVVGITGMGGIGKTTLGYAVYERISHQYDFCCYIEDVNKVYGDSSRSGVQNQLLSQTLNEKDLEIRNASEGTWLSWTRLRHARALIVLDNVDKVEQLEMFTGSRDTLLRECLGGGSRIIIISRDQHLLRTHGVDDVYQVQELNEQDAVRLFCKNAFKSHSIMSEFQKLADEVLSHANGHPLAIKVLGSSLFDRDVLQWRSALARLKENKGIMDVLRISFDQLEDTEKEIFLDIACFFDEWLFNTPKIVKEILDFRGFHPEYGLQVLADKSLITMWDYFVDMHGLLRDLGKSIVREKSPKNPRKWSRLWDLEDLYKVMSVNTPAENFEVEAIVCNSWCLTKEIKADALSKMSHLKLLILPGVRFSGAIKNLSNELGYLEWSNYPFECLPQSFQPDNLVELKLQYSKIKQLWEGKKPLHNLKRLDLSHSKNLIEMPYLGEAPKLEVLHLEGCKQLTKIDPSIGLLRKLTVLNLKNCKNLVSLPNSILGLNSLESLDLSGCSKLYSIQSLDEQRDSKYWKKLYIGGVNVPIYSESASSYSKAHKDSVTSLPIFPFIRELDLSFCNLVEIPEAIGSLCSLEYLDLSGNNFCTLPNLKKLSKMFRLNLQHCKKLKYLPQLPSRIDFGLTTYKYSERNGGLYVFNCQELVEKKDCTSKAFSLIVQLLLQYYARCEGKIRAHRWLQKGSTSIQSVTPGSEIPRWFNNQHVSKDNYISIDPSPVMHDTSVGVMCCVVFKIRPERTSIYTNLRMVDIQVDLYGDKELVLDNLEHMCIFFVDKSNFHRHIYLHLGFNLGFSAKFYVEVKKYRYRWVYEQDVELLNLTMMHSANSSSRKRKFWGIEEKERKRRKESMWAKIRKDDAANSTLENTLMLLQNQFQNLGL